MTDERSPAPDAARSLRETVERYAPAPEARRIVERAMREAGLSELPRDRARFSSFVEGYVAPLVVVTLAPDRREEARETLRRVVSSVFGRSPSIRAPAGHMPSFREEAVTLEVSVRGFSEILAISGDEALDIALRPFAELGTKLVRVPVASEADISGAMGTLVVVLDGRRTSLSADALLAQVALREERTTLVVWGDASLAEHARALGVRRVVVLPAAAGADSLRAVVRLGPA
jgi:hypothetical protein